MQPLYPVPVRLKMTMANSDNVRFLMAVGSSIARCYTIGIIWSSL